MRAVDTNVLIYAEMITSRHHTVARRLDQELAEDSRPGAIPWPCVYEFLRVATHPRVYHPPAPPEIALEDLRRILASPSLVLLAQTGRHAEIMGAVLQASGATGNLVHDAHIAALCLENGVSELLTGDRDLSRFPGLRIEHPSESRRSIRPSSSPAGSRDLRGRRPLLSDGRLRRDGQPIGAGACALAGDLWKNQVRGLRGSAWYRFYEIRRFDIDPDLADSTIVPGRNRVACLPA